MSILREVAGRLLSRLALGGQSKNKRQKKRYSKAIRSARSLLLVGKISAECVVEMISLPGRQQKIFAISSRSGFFEGQGVESFDTSGLHCDEGIALAIESIHRALDTMVLARHDWLPNVVIVLDAAYLPSEASIRVAELVLAAFLPIAQVVVLRDQLECTADQCHLRLYESVFVAKCSRLSIDHLCAAKDLSFSLRVDLESSADGALFFNPDTRRPHSIA